jgi:molybdopterin/thiamine biosynthesis adenylyltransferase
LIWSISSPNSLVVKLELVCQNEEVEKAIQLICENARSPEPGDGIVYITEIADAIRIMTGDSLKRYDLLKEYIKYEAGVNKLLSLQFDKNEIINRKKTKSSHSLL